MAAMHFTRTSIFNNISKANNIPRFTSLSFPHKTSRICFTSASKHSQGRHASEETNNGYNEDEAVSYSSGDYNSSDRAKNKMEQGKDRMKEGAGEMKDNTMNNMKDWGTEMKHKTDNIAGKASDKAGDMAGKAADKAGDMKDDLKEKTYNKKESAKDTVNTSASKAGEGTNKVADMAGAVVEKTKETVAGAWDAAKGTSQKIKETVVGTSSDDEDDWGDKRGGKPKVMDEDVVNSRRKVGNLDHEKKDY